MVGPVFAGEMLRAGRRGRAHVLRWLFAGWLAVQFHFLIADYAVIAAQPSTPRSEISAFARGVVDTLLAQEFMLLVLVTPAFAAGAVTDEKTRGTLQTLFTTHLSSAAIVLGKLCARAAQVGVIGLTPLPLIAVLGPYAGVTPEFLLVLFAVMALLLFGLSALSILASVWARQTRTAVLVSYAALAGLWLVAPQVAGSGLVPALAPWLEAFDPLRPLAPALDAADPGEAFRRLGGFARVWGGVGVVCTALAVWRLRPAYVRQLQARPRGRFAVARLWPRPAPTLDVLAWKECYVGRRVPLWLGLPLAFGLGAFVADLARQTPPATGRPRAAPEIAILMQSGLWVLLALSLVVGVRASGTITGERERQTWDGLLTAPLSNRELVRGKLRGILRSVWPYLLAYLLAVAVTLVLLDPRNRGPLLFLAPAAALAVASRWLGRRVFRVAVVGLVLAAALAAGLEIFLITAVELVVCRLALSFMGAAGLYCSALSSNSWRSLLGTVAIGYMGGFALIWAGIPLCCLTILIFIPVAAVLNGVFQVIDPSSGSWLSQHWEVMLPLAWAFGVSIAYGWMAQRLLRAAETRVARRDRIPTGRVRLIDMDLPVYSQPLHRQSRR